MNRLVTPVGPKSKAVYIRRRVFVLLGLLAIVAAVVLIILKPGSTGGAASGNAVDLPDDLVNSEQADAEQLDSDEGVVSCATGQLEVTPVTDAESYAADAQPQLSLSVQNTGDEKCTADLGTAGMTFLITSGSEELWRSADCQENPDHRLVILDAGETLTTEPITWDRTRSSPETCEITRDPVVAGGASYHLRVTAAGVDGHGTKQFLLY